MTKAHTQGQWSIEGSKVVGNGYNIAHVNSHATSEGKANARLISTAPELLADAEKKQSALAEIHALLHTHAFSEEEKKTWLVQEVLRCVEIAWENMDFSAISKAKGE